MRISVIVPAVELDFDPQPLPPQSESNEQATAQPQTRPSGPQRATVAPQQRTVGQRILNQSSQVSTSSNVVSEGVLASLTRIQETTQGIVDSLLQKEKEQKELEDKRRKREETARRIKAEGLLESSVKKIADSFKRVIAPIQSIWDKIVHFLTTIFLGKLLLNLLDWISDPKNKDKVNSLFRFFKDFWPAIIGTFVLFGTSFGKFIRSTVGLVINLGKFISKVGMGGLRAIALSLGRRALVGALVTGVAVGGLYGASKLLEPKEEKESSSTQPIRRYSGGGKIKPLKLMAPEKQEINIKDLKHAGGGEITDGSGLTISGAGVDTQLIAARPGEVVISKEAVDKFGSDLFLGLNQAGGGTNKPKNVMAGKIQLASGGGQVGKTSNKIQVNTSGSNGPAVNLALPHIKQEEALSSLTRGINDYIREGKTSTVNRIPWSKLNPKTPIHAYADAGGLPTIGWGATFYDSLLSGNKKVKMGDVTSKEQADKTLKFQVSDLANAYSKEVPFWGKMTTNQRAGLLLTGFHRPYSFLGASGYSDYGSALKKGDMKTLANNISKKAETPPQRLALQKRLILSGPLDLSKVTEAPKPQEAKPKPQNFFGGVKDAIMQFTGVKKAEISPSTPSINAPSPKPRRGTAFTQLPAISVNSGTPMQGSPGSSDVPDLTASSPFPEEKRLNAQAYGLA
jgi:GH24 family phage-related lysozyme (muramidase)